jgi:hypothetical protein
VTVIAWDGKALAGDKQTTGEDRRHACVGARARCTACKGADGKHRLVGCAGDTGDCQSYVRCGARLGEGSDRLHEFTSVGSVAMHRRAQAHMVADHRIQWQRIRHPFIAIGNGGDFALGALAAGESAREAVRIASRLSASCGFGVDVVRF